MKRFCLLALGALFAAILAGCNQTITITPSTPGTSAFSAPTGPISLARGESVTFVNKDDVVHKIAIGKAAPVTVYPQGSGAGRPSSFTWKPPATTPIGPITWKCIIHTGESGTITISP